MCWFTRSVSWLINVMFCRERRPRKIQSDRHQIAWSAWVRVFVTSSQWIGGHLNWHSFFPFTQRHDRQPSSHSDPAWLTHTGKKKQNICIQSQDFWNAGKMMMPQQAVSLSVTYTHMTGHDLFIQWIHWCSGCTLVHNLGYVRLLWCCNYTIIYLCERNYLLGVFAVICIHKRVPS